MGFALPQRHTANWATPRSTADSVPAVRPVHRAHATQQILRTVTADLAAGSMAARCRGKTGTRQRQKKRAVKGGFYFRKSISASHLVSKRLRLALTAGDGAVLCCVSVSSLRREAAPGGCRLSVRMKKGAAPAAVAARPPLPPLNDAPWEAAPLKKSASGVTAGDCVARTRPCSLAVWSCVCLPLYR